MPRLPTMRVMGSHDISTTSPLPSNLLGLASGLACVAVIECSVCRRERELPGAGGSGGELTAVVAPLGLLVDRLERHLAQVADELAVGLRAGGRQLAAGRLVHERHELVREAGHRAADADAAHVRTPADAVEPAALRHV